MITKDVESWIEMIEQHKCKSIFADRDLFIWGAYSKGLNICVALESQGYFVKGYLDSYKCGIYKNKPIFLPDRILTLMPKPFIFVAIENIRDEIIEALDKHGFKKNIDYIYFTESIPEIEISGLRGSYEDIYHNTFLCKEKSMVRGINIFCRGGNNTISIGKDVTYAEDCMGGGYNGLS